METIGTNDLGQNLDQLVADFVQAAQSMVLAAVAEGLAVKPAAPAKVGSKTKRPKPTKRTTSSKSDKSPKPSERSRPNKRRTQKELTELAERFYDVLYRHPGATMAVLARKVGASPRELQRPVALLKRAGRVRTVGDRQWTTYFPIARAVEVDAAA